LWWRCPFGSPVILEPAVRVRFRFDPLLARLFLLVVSLMSFFVWSFLSFVVPSVVLGLVDLDMFVSFARELL